MVIPCNLRLNGFLCLLLGDTFTGSGAGWRWIVSARRFRDVVWLQGLWVGYARGGLLRHSCRCRVWSSYPVLEGNKPHCQPGEFTVLKNVVFALVFCFLCQPDYLAVPWLFLGDPFVQYYTHTHLFNGPFSGTTQVSRYQKGKTNLDFTEARDGEWQWQWHQLGHMQVCTSPDR